MISVLIVNYFSATMLLECAKSLKGIHELVVVDNSADPGERQTLETLRQTQKVKLIFNSQNLGFAKAVNQAAAEAEGDLLLILNPDTYLFDTTLPLLKAELAKDKVGAVGPLIQFPDGREQGGARRLAPSPGRAIAKLLGLTRLGISRDYDLSKTELPKAPQPVEVLSGACMLLSKDLYEELGGMDEAYIMHCEDLDLCMRIKLKGLELVFVPDAKVVHVKGHSSNRQPLWVAWHLHKGMLLYYRKYFRARYSAPMWFLVVASVYARFIVFSMIKLAKQLLGK